VFAYCSVAAAQGVIAAPRLFSLNPQ
jgi:hypothetical protein